MSDLRSLIEAAKADGPSAAARAKVWVGVSKTVGGVASIAGASAVTASTGAAKLLIFGALLGGTVTVGVGAAVLVAHGASHGRAGVSAAFATPAPAAAESTFLPRPTPLEDPASADAVEAVQRAGAGANSDPSTLVAVQVDTSDEGSNANAVSGSTVPTSLDDTIEGRRKTPLFHASATRGGQAGQMGTDDPLAREASLLASARNALVRRDALSALQIVRGLRMLPARQLVPEELAVEAQSLRSLGLDAEADTVEARLRNEFPDSVLGR